MADTITKYVLIMGFSCLLQPAIAAIPSVSQQLVVKNSLLDDAQEEVQKLTTQIEAKEKENKQLELNIKRFTLDVKRLSLDTAPSDATQKALLTAQFEVKRAQFTLDKNNSAIKQLLADRDTARTKKRSYGMQIDQIKNNQPADTHINTAEAAAKIKQEQVALAAKQALEKERLHIAEQRKLLQMNSEKARQQQAALAAEQGRLRIAQQQKEQQQRLSAEKARQEQLALAAKQAAEQQRLLLAEQQKAQQLKQQQRDSEKARQEQLASAAKQAAEQQRLQLAEQQKAQQLKQQLDADKAQQEQLALAAKQAAEQQRLQLAEQQKTQQLKQQLNADKAQQEQLASAAKQAAEQQRLRFAEEDKLNAIAAAKELAKHKPEFETVAIPDKDADQGDDLPETHAKPLTDFQKLQLLTTISDEQKEKEAAYQDLNQRVAEKEKSATAKPLTQQQQAQKHFIETSKNLPPAESALTLAMARSLDAASEQPAWGTHPDLAVANPVGSYPKSIGKMKYLGNNQYMLELRVAKGKQQFNLGNTYFIKNIPEHFDGIRCLLLVDARNKDKPNFQLVIAGG